MHLKATFRQSVHEVDELQVIAIVTRTDRRTRTCAHRQVETPPSGASPRPTQELPIPVSARWYPPAVATKRRGLEAAQAP